MLTKASRGLCGLQRVVVPAAMLGTQCSSSSKSDSCEGPVEALRSLKGLGPLHSRRWVLGLSFEIESRETLKFGAPMGQMSRKLPELYFFNLVFPLWHPWSWCQVRCPGPCYKSGALYGDPFFCTKI